ncbi:transcriptional regulator TbsP [Haloquadratum walsbyi]|uniref:transcriptional regulator TbsP n=1 Tax=Haloquadratum walsbyi TaxID=293091 RepID=UPI0023F4CE5A|nr:DUF5821 family protein [Haloquadratum walsbyi]
MSLDANVLGTDMGHVLSSVLSEVTGAVYVVNPTQDLTKALVTDCSDILTNDTSVRLLSDEQRLKEVMDNFIVASNAAELVDSNVLTLRVGDVSEPNSLIVTTSATVAMIQTNNQVAGLIADEIEFVTSVRDSYEQAFESATSYPLQTPAISSVRSTLASEIGDETRSDFDSVLTTLQTARDDRSALNEVIISLLVAAKNNVLLYDISKWGEDVGIASKATFSRTKTELEESGLIDTEKVPIDVGRPRLRLKLGHNQLVRASSDQLAGVAESLLA